MAIGRKRWPEIDVSIETLLELLAAYEITPPTSAAGFESLYLAAAAINEDARAVKQVELWLTRAKVKVGHLMDGHDFADEVLQRTREKLLLGPPPAIVRYAHRGNLPGLVALIAGRTAISIHRKTKPTTSEEALERFPDLTVAAKKHNKEFKAAFATAVQKLSSRERNILRLTLDASIAQSDIATLYQCHPATLRRWLVDIRLSLLKATKESMANELGASPSIIDEIVASLGSQLDASFSRILAPTEA